MHIHSQSHTQSQPVTNPTSRTDRHTHPESLRKSSRVTKPLSLTLNTHCQTKIRTHTTTKVHTWSHAHIYTESQSLSHTQTDTEQYTVTHREKQTHTVAHRPLEIQNNGRIVWAGSSWGEKSRSVDGGGCGGCRTTPTHPRSIPSLFPLPEVEFSWDLDLLRDSALRYPLLSLLPCLVGDAGLPCGPASFWGSGDSGSFSP